MAFLDDHCFDCLTLLGKAHLEVHLWLDRMCRVYPPPIYGEFHRTFVHNTYGLTIIEHKWGEEGKKAGYIHLLRDYLEAPIVQKGLDVVLQLAKRNMPWWDNVNYEDPYWEDKI